MEGALDDRRQPALTPPAPGRALYNKRFRVMGGGGMLRFVDDRGPERAEAIAAKAVAEAERIERKYSRYLEDSVVSRINRNAGRTPVAVDEETIRLVGHALRLAERTGGAFDPTVGVLRRVWDFRGGKAPSPEAIEALLPLVDWRQVSVRNGTLFLRREGMELDLGGIGKEYAVDRVAGRLREEGVESAVVNLAGDVRTLGARGDGRPWRIGIMDPRRKETCRFSVRLMGDGGVASSGDYERYFIEDGVRQHHILDARTGWPVRGVAAVTVVAPDTFRAGLAATAVFMLGPVEGMRLLRESPAVEGVLVTTEDELLATPGMDRLSDLPGSMYAAYPTL